MKIIKLLSEYIEDELCDAEKYIEAALKYREQFPEIGNMFFILSSEELKHMATLHASVVQLISDYRKNNSEPPENMIAIYDYLHEKFIEKEKEVKILQEMYKVK